MDGLIVIHKIADRCVTVDTKFGGERESKEKNEEIYSFQNNHDVLFARWPGKFTNRVLERETGLVAWCILNNSLFLPSV